MKKLIVVLVLFLTALIFFQCGKDDGPVGPNIPEPSFTDNVVNLQQQGLDLFSNLITARDTAAALDSVLKYFLKDGSVDSGVISTQGISLFYKNGIRGGLCVNPQDGGASPLPKMNIPEVPVISANPGDYMPTSKKTIFINPHYWDRVPQASYLINCYNSYFAKVGYNAPETYLNADASIDLLLNLSGYGIIHIYSHGYAWPDADHLQTVYLMAGENVNAATDKNYEKEIKNGSILVMTATRDGEKYWISPSLFASHNNLAIDQSIVYGGFCYSFLGGWPNAVTNVSKAGVYTGFSWSVNTNKNFEWARSLFYWLTAKNLPTPKSVGDWFSDPYESHRYWSGTANRYVYIYNAGHSELTLWSGGISIKVDPDTAFGKPEETITFTAKASKKITESYKCIWDFGDGTAKQTHQNDSVATHKYAVKGTYNINVRLLDQADKELAAANSTAEITEANNNLPPFTLATIDIMIYSRQTSSHQDSVSNWSITDTILYTQNISIPITVLENTFSGDTTNAGLNSVNGTYDPVSKKLSFHFNQSWNESQANSSNIYTGGFTVSGLPLTSEGSFYYFNAEGMAVCSFVTALNYNHVIVYYTTRDEKTSQSFFCVGPPAIYESRVRITLH